jgi:hypothetical protein
MYLNHEFKGQIPLTQYSSVKNSLPPTKLKKRGLRYFPPFLRGARGDLKCFV